MINFQKDYSMYSTNSQDSYFTLQNYPGLDFNISVNHYSHWLAINVSLSGFDVPTVSCLQFYVNKTTQKLTVYGLFFRFCELAKMDWQQFMRDICQKIGYQPKDRLIRGDYKIDIFWLTPDEFLFKLSRNNRETYKRITAKYQKKGKLETVYLWNKTSKYAFPRVYDKNKDTIKKHKEAFYEDYLQQNTTRLEIQTWSNFIWNMNTEQRLEKIQHYIGDKTKTFQGNYFVGKRYNPNFILNTNMFSKRLENWLLKAIENWYNLQTTFDSVNKKQRYKKLLVTESPRTLLSLISSNEPSLIAPPKPRIE